MRQKFYTGEFLQDIYDSGRYVASNFFDRLSQMGHQYHIMIFVDSDKYYKVLTNIFDSNRPVFEDQTANSVWIWNDGRFRDIPETYKQDTIVVKLSTYHHLVELASRALAYEASGVNNWEGYEEAMLHYDEIHGDMLGDD